MKIDRRSFVKKTCSCLTAPWVVTLFSGCEATRYVSGTLEPNGISLIVSEFVSTKDEKTTYRPYIIIRNEQLEYPICLYRFSEKDYSALLMKCTHQGTELQAAGDHLQCPAHGSEFNNRGTVAQGPAQLNLRAFPVQVMNDKLLIELK